MKNKIKYFFFLSSMFLLSPFNFLSAAGLSDANAKLTEAGVGMGFKTESVDISTIVGNVIQALLGLLGVIFLGLIVYGGFIWMIARGNEKRVTEAKDIMINSTIGLVIVLSAYAITTYVISALINNLNVID
jgi:type IV secretion system pilin